MSRNLSTQKRGPKQPLDGHIQPNRTLGQNFLKDAGIVKKIIEASRLEKGETVLEIGPGGGAMTFALAERAGLVIAIEKDQQLAATLKDTIRKREADNIKIIEGDVLDFIKNDRLAIKGLPEKYKVVANIPYYLTSFLIRKLLEIKNRPADIFLMVQREVGERICAKPPKMSILSVAVDYYALPKLLFRVPRGCFYPQPKVDSVFVRITPKEGNNDQKFFTIVRAGFSHPRKQLINNLSESLKISREEAEKWLFFCGIDKKRRAETLSIDEWIHLYKEMTIIE